MKNNKVRADRYAREAAVGEEPLEEPLEALPPLSGEGPDCGDPPGECGGEGRERGDGWSEPKRGGVGGSGKSRPGSDTAKEEASSGDGRGVPGADGETSLVKARAGVRNRESSTAPSWIGD